MKDSGKQFDNVFTIHKKTAEFFAVFLFHRILKFFDIICGRIINIVSGNTKIVARPDIVSYVAAKAGIMQMTKALAVEWADYGITVNAIAPGF